MESFRNEGAKFEVNLLMSREAAKLSGEIGDVDMLQRLGRT